MRRIESAAPVGHGYPHDVLLVAQLNRSALGSGVPYDVFERLGHGPGKGVGDIRRDKARLQVDRHLKRLVPGSHLR